MAQKHILERTLTIVALLFMGACASVHQVKPLEKGEKEISATLGGPLFKLSGLTIPMPNTTISGAYGVTDKITTYGSLYPTSLLYGIIQMDAGLVYGLSKPNGKIPGLSAGMMLNGAVSKWDGAAKLWPSLELNAYHELGFKKHLLYYGVSSWFELSGQKAHEEPQNNHALINPHLGFRYNHSSWSFSLEMKYLASNVSNENLAVKYVRPFSTGVPGVYLGFVKHLKKKEKMRALVNPSF